MILPIVTLGDAILFKKCEAITKDYPDLEKLIFDMIETMLKANGIGLAAPQIDKSIRLFIIGFPNHGEIPLKVFINAQIISTEGSCVMGEGCLSIPGVSGDVERPEKITINYFDQNFTEHTNTFDGLTARVIQHEYDHIEGILYVNHLTDEAKESIKDGIDAIVNKQVKTKYLIKLN